MLPHTTTIGPVVVFDGVCKLCNAWCQFVIKHDFKQTIKLCSAQSDQGQEILRHFQLNTEDYESMLYVEDDAYSIKGEAFFKAVSHFGFPWKLLGILSIFPSSLVNWFYDRIANNRYRLFGKYQHCVIPSSEHAHRYLDAEH